MQDLLLRDQNRAELIALAAHPPHALLLVGPAGLGKRHVAVTWGRQLAPFVEVVEPDEKGTFGIDTVRSLYQRTRGKQKDAQVVVCDHAEAMGIEAQNAFLKLLEEPPQGVTFILTTPSAELLLPTISSRLQIVHLQPMARHTLQQWAQQRKNLNPQELNQLLFVAQGRPAITATLLADKNAFDRHRRLMQRAKQLLGASAYERLAAINDLIKDKSELIAILEAMGHMMHMQIAKGDTAWLPLADALQLCLTRLAQNANPRAQLTNLFLQFVL